MPLHSKFRPRQLGGSELSNNVNYTYRRGVNYKALRGDAPISFRILPAFPLHECVPVVDNSGNQLFDKNGIPLFDKIADGEKLPDYAWFPFVSEEGDPYEFAATLYIARFVGRGDNKSRRSIVSRRTLVELDPSGEVIRQDDPYSEVFQFCDSRDSATWGYLTKPTGTFGKSDYRNPVLPRISKSYLLNIVTTADPTKVQLGEIATVSAMKRLIDDENSLMFALNKHATDEQIAENYLAAYDNGDLTDPEEGNVLTIEKETDKGQASGYDIKLASRFDPAKKRMVFQKMPISEELLAQRYDLSMVQNIVNIPTPEQQVEQIVASINGRTPDGMFHEYTMLKEAFLTSGHEDWAAMVPDPPLAPARGSVRGYSTPEEQADSEAEYEGALGADIPQARQAQQVHQAPRKWVPPVRKAVETAPVEEEARPAIEKVAPPPPPVQNDPVPGVAGEKPSAGNSWIEKYRAKKAAQAAAASQEG